MDYEIGDIIRYQPIGGALIRRVKVTSKEADINNGRPGFMGQWLDFDNKVQGEVWGYDDQIFSLET